jgi:hypothetical protein
MSNSFLKQLGLAFKIWLVAVLANALLGVSFMSIINGNWYPWQQFGLVLLVGGIFSIPCMIAVLVIIALLAKRVNGMRLFWAVEAGGLTATVLAYSAFMNLIGGNDRELKNLMFVAMLAAIVSVATFYRSLFKWGHDFNTI